MSKNTIAVVGLSGVGKSTLLVSLSSDFDFLHLQASTLIRNAKAEAQTFVEHDQLRYANLDEDQKNLVAGFHSATAGQERLVVLDAHTVIEREGDYFLIAPEVFGAIGIVAMILIIDRPSAIEFRRLSDTSRKRQQRQAIAIAELQQAALAQARTICDQLSVPLDVIELTDRAQIAAMLARYSKRPSPS